MKADTDIKQKVREELSGEWRNYPITLHFFPAKGSDTGSMEWLNFSPVSVRRMDYFIATIDGGLRLKLQNNNGEENFFIALSNNNLLLKDCNGNCLNFVKIY